MFLWNIIMGRVPTYLALENRSHLRFTTKRGFVNYSRLIRGIFFRAYGKRHKSQSMRQLSISELVRPEPRILQEYTADSSKKIEIKLPIIAINFARLIRLNVLSYISLSITFSVILSYASITLNNYTYTYERVFNLWLYLLTKRVSFYD